MIAIRLPFQFDVEPILAEVERLPSEAFVEVQSSHINPGGLLACNLLVPDLELVGKQDGFRLIPGPWLSSSPAILEVIDALQCEKNMARIHKLQPQAKIDEHTDGITFLQGMVRVHVPLTTGEGSRFVLAGKLLDMQAGETWILNVGKPHEVENRDAKERVHLVIDCHRNDWLDNLLKNLGQFPEEKAYSNLTNTDLKNMLLQLQAMGSEGMQFVLEEVTQELERRKSIASSEQ